MKREIKFRARRKDNGLWAYGYFVKTPITTEFGCEGQFLDTGKGRYCIIQHGVAHEIDIETLGQSTGRKDKNEVEIYEGDMVKQGSHDICEVFFRNGSFSTYLSKDRSDGWLEMSQNGFDFEVVI